MKNFLISELSEAAYLIQQGGLVAFPTETVYGLGASVFLPEAIQKIFQVKGRPQDNPLIVHISDFNQLDLIVQEIPPAFFQLAEFFFPGPLTILLPKKETVPTIVSANLPTIGVRMPAHPLARQLIEKVGVPLVAPSANLSGKPSSTTAQHVLEDFQGMIEGVLDGGPCLYGIESTVITLLPQPLILRPGAISRQQIEGVLKTSVSYAEEHADKPLSPGMKYRHYAPKAKVVLFDTPEQLKDFVRCAPEKHRRIFTSLQPEHLYANFRQADREGFDEILVLCTEEMKAYRALMNRLRRAANT